MTPEEKVANDTNIKLLEFAGFTNIRNSPYADGSPCLMADYPDGILKGWTKAPDFCKDANAQIKWLHPKLIAGKCEFGMGYNQGSVSAKTAPGYTVWIIKGLGLSDLGFSNYICGNDPIKAFALVVAEYVDWLKGPK